MKVGLLAVAALVAQLSLAFAAAEERPVPRAYAQLVYSHIQQYKGAYPASAQGPSGHVVVKLVLDRDGGVVSSTILKSSRIGTLDQAALAIVQSAKPFPRFSSDMTGSTASFTAPFYFHPDWGPVCELGTTFKMTDGKMHPCQ